MFFVILIAVILVVVYFASSPKSNSSKPQTEGTSFDKYKDYWMYLLDDASHFLEGFDRRIFFHYDYSTKEITADITVVDADYYLDQYNEFMKPGAAMYMGEDNVNKMLFGNYKPQSVLISSLENTGRKQYDNLVIKVSLYCASGSEDRYLSQLFDSCKQKFPDNTGNLGKGSFWVMFKST